MGLTEQRYKILRSKLDDLGYRQPLALESLLLVEQIFSDLIHTKEERDHFKNLYHQNQERFGDARTGIEPLKQENEKLKNECRRLRQALSEEQDVNEKLFKDLKHRIRALESNNSDLEFVCSQHLERINELSRQLAEKGQKILQLKGLSKPTSYNKLSVPKTHPKKPSSASSVGTRAPPVKPTSTYSDLYPVKPSSDQLTSHQLTGHQLTSVAEVCGASKRKIDSLLKELVTLKQEKLDCLEEIAAVQSKVAVRNQEIERLQHMLELANNTPMPNAGKCLINCCKERCCCGNGGKGSYMEAQLREQLTECQELQHEAMCRAVKLAERNAQLEEQLINSRTGGTCKCVTDDQNTVRMLQEKLDCKLLEIEELESKLKEVQKANKELETEKGASESVSNEQKKLEERVRELNIIERDLMTEIERLKEVNHLQHDRIQHLENRLTETEKKLAENEAANHGKTRNNRLKSTESMPHESTNKSHARTSLDTSGKSANNLDSSFENRRSNSHDTSKANAVTNQKTPVKKIGPSKNVPTGGSSLKTQNVANNNGKDDKDDNGKDKTLVKEKNKFAATLETRYKNKTHRKLNQRHINCAPYIDTEDEDVDDGLKGVKSSVAEREMMSKQMQAQSSKSTKTTDKNAGKVTRYQKSPVRPLTTNHNASKTGDAKKTLERVSPVESRAVKTAPKPVPTRGKSKDETDASSSSSETNNAGPVSKSDRFSSLKSKKSTTSSLESERRLKEKAQEEEKLRREKQMLDDERKRLEEIIRNLTEKQTELINKLQEAYAGSEKRNEQGEASSRQSDKEQIIKLERLQAERDNYQKELSKIRDQISNLVDSNTAAEPGLRTQSPSCILQRLVTERDFYQKEFNRLQKQLSTVNSVNHDQSDVSCFCSRKCGCKTVNLHAFN